MQRWKVLVALIVTATVAACGSPDTNGGSTLDTLLPPPTGEVQDAPPPGASTSTTSAASAGPVPAMAPTIPAWSPGRPIGGGTGTTGATSATQPGSTTETTGTEQTSSTTGASSTTQDSNTSQASSTTAPTPPTTHTTTPTQQAQTITFAPLVAPWAYGETRSIMASASSALPVVFDAKGACVVDNAELGVVRANDVGECSVTVSQKGDASWKAAPPVTRSTTISRATPVISGFEDTSTEHPRVKFSIPLTASASTGAPVGYHLLANAASEKLCTVSGAVLEVQVTNGPLPQTCTVAAFVEESRLYEAAISTARFTISPTVVAITGHTLIEVTDTSVTLSVNLNVAWQIDVVATAPVGDLVVPCGTPPGLLEGAATYTFSVALLAPIAAASPCDVTVTIHTVDAAHTSDELIIKLP